MGESREEMWTALGDREYNGKKVSAWIDSSGADRIFRDRRSFIIGAVYAVTVSDTPTGGISRHGDPVFVRADGVGPELKREWAAAEVAARAKLARLSRERHAGKQDALDDALEPLRAVARTLRNQAERDALAAYIIRRITRDCW